MKITAGLGSIDEYIPYVKAGADEVFCGYVPEKWALKYGLSSPLNRREVLYYNVQLGSRSELQILADMREAYHAPIAITLNSLYYGPEQYPVIGEIVSECLQEGFDTFIVADPALLLYLRQQFPFNHLKIHISGEMSEMNHITMEWCRELGASRMIFHRKVSIADMQAMIQKEGKWEYEAFVLNENCHFHGGFCNSLHCDEFTHMCRVPYRISPLREVKSSGAWNNEAQRDVSRRDAAERNAAERCASQREVSQRNAAQRNAAQGEMIRKDELWKDKNSQEKPVDEPGIGTTGCGFCALWKLREMGVTHLKLVSRGNYADDTIRDIRALRDALDILNERECSWEAEFIDQMKEAIFPRGCSKKCYYLE